MTKGIVYISVGEWAAAQCGQALESLSKIHPEMATQIVSDGNHHEIKTLLYQLSRFDQTLYMDADTRVMADLSIFFSYLDAGHEMVFVPNCGPMDMPFWHLGNDDRSATLDECGDIFHLTSAVFAFRKTEGTRVFFERWNSEWNRFHGKDEGALHRALKNVPVTNVVVDGKYNSLLRSGKVLHIFERSAKKVS